MSNTLYEVKGLGFAYNNGTGNVLSDVSFEINKGDFAVLCGPSGSGKTTLLRHLKPSMVPVGKVSGTISYMGRDISLLSDERQAADIGYIFQEPESQIVTDHVWSELAFGLESLGLPNNVIRQKVADVASYYGLNGIYNKSTDELSGGEKQLVNLAAVMVMDPTTLILDEPVSRLDPVSRARFIDTLGRINRELGITIIASTHSLEEWLPLSTHLLIMEEGRLINMYPRSDYQDMVNECGQCIADALPAESRLYALIGDKDGGRCPFGISEGRRWLRHRVMAAPSFYKKISGVSDDKRSVKNNHNNDNDDVVVSFSNVYYGYSPEAGVIKNMSCNIKRGEVYGVIGSNGSGKSTFMSLAAGILKPSHGKINIKDGCTIALLPQRPELLFRHKNVSGELDRAGFNGAIRDEVINSCGLAGLLDRNPYDLSGGERQRAALAIVMMADTDIILMDEPSKGMDAVSKSSLADIIRNMSGAGKTIIIVSHDIEFVAECTDRCGMLFDGMIVSENSTREFLLNNNYYTTPVVRLTKGIIDNCVLISDVAGVGEAVTDMSVDGGHDKSAKQTKAAGEAGTGGRLCEDSLGQDVAACSIKYKDYKKKNADSAFNFIILLIYAIIIPATVWFGVTVLQDRKYFFIAMMIMLESMLPFYISYERKKYSARTVVIVAVLCAVAVASRAAFYMIPQFKPIVAVVIISSVALGGELGFVVGSLSMLVSNVLFGQGPWTPWQMFAMGMVGLISGLIFYRHRYKVNRLLLCIVSFFVTLAVYGGIVDMSTLFYVNDDITLKVITAVYLAGLPFNLVLAGATVLFLWIMAVPVIGKLLRLVK